MARNMAFKALVYETSVAASTHCVAAKSSLVERNVYATWNVLAIRNVHAKIQVTVAMAMFNNLVNSLNSGIRIVRNLNISYETVI